MRRRTIVQRGDAGENLFIYCHTDAKLVKSRVTGRISDAVAVEHWGAGASAYRPLLEAYGGFDAWIAAIARECGKDGFRRVCLTTWSAGSQVAKEVCKGGSLPDAIVMLDGLYASKPAGARPGDGQVAVDEGLRAIARYAADAARGERIMAILHSEIPTSYASSAECAAAVRRMVEAEVGPLGLDPDVSAEEVGAFTGAVGAGGLHILGFPGTGAAEHVREGQLYDTCWRLFLPWWGP